METAVKNTRIQFPLRDGLTKKEVSEMADKAVESVLEKGNVFQVAEALSAMEDFTKAVRADARFIGYIREELAKYNGKHSTASGAKIEACETGTSYDFSLCNDAEFEKLEAAFNEAKAALDQRKDFLKTVMHKGLIITDPETGETREVFPPAKSSKSSYKLTLAK